MHVAFLAGVYLFFFLGLLEFCLLLESFPNCVLLQNPS